MFVRAEMNRGPGCSLPPLLTAARQRNCSSTRRKRTPRNRPDSHLVGRHGGDSYCQSNLLSLSHDALLWQNTRKVPFVGKLEIWNPYGRRSVGFCRAIIESHDTKRNVKVNYLSALVGWLRQSTQSLSCLYNGCTVLMHWI